MSLTAKQQRFVDEYLVDLNATQAAIRAEYSAKTAEQQSSRLLSNVKVQRELAKRFAERAERVNITQDYVLSMLVKNVERAMQQEAVTDESGVVINYKYNGAVANKALELLGKHLGMFTDKIDVTASIQTVKGVDFSPYNE